MIPTMSFFGSPKPVIKSLVRRNMARHYVFEHPLRVGHFETGPPMLKHVFKDMFVHVHIQSSWRKPPCALFSCVKGKGHFASNLSCIQQTKSSKTA